MYLRSGTKSILSAWAARNLVDSEVMLGILLKAGYEVAPALEESDYIVINTCGFLEASRNESMEAVQDTLAAAQKNCQTDRHRLHGANAQR